MNTPLQWLTLLLRVFLGGYFLFAAVPKIAEPYAFSVSIVHYQMMPDWSINAFALVMPWLEALVGVCLVLGLRVRSSAVVSGVLLVMFIAAIGWAMANGLNIDCGCFGEGNKEEVGWGKIFKNLGMLAMCVYMVWQPRSPLALESLLVEEHLPSAKDERQTARESR
ncbi:MAG: MauE/DoxX family redox-associated membrane protein [bacterium]|nr:MauE/DoxX family redox-associated membrane protein [bacterium]